MDRSLDAGATGEKGSELPEKGTSDGIHSAPFLPLFLFTGFAIVVMACMMQATRRGQSNKPQRQDGTGRTHVSTRM